MVNGLEDVTEQNRRLVSLRWLAIGGVVTAALASWWLRLVPSVLPLYAVATAMAAANVGLGIVVRRLPDGSRRLLLGQLGLDLLALTTLLHFSGGIENPFAFYYIFLVIIASLSCTRREAYAFGAAAFALYAGVTTLEYVGALPHHHLRLPALGSTHAEHSGSGEYLAGVLVVLASTMAGVVVFSSATMDRLRASVEAERLLRQRIDEQERLAIIGEVVAGVVHELNSPLNGVRNSFRALRRDPEGFLKREGLMQLMEEALDRMASISRRLLTLAREPQIERQPVLVNEIVERSLAELQHRLDSAGVSLRCRLAPGLLPILADRVAVGEVVTNLLTNAADAVEGGGEVTIETSNGRGAVEIRVIDTGLGIPPSMRGRLFQPFHSTKPAGKGTGLGLAISKRLVEAHGGSIAIDSPDGEGTTVVVRLPAGERSGP